MQSFQSCGSSPWLTSYASMVCSCLLRGPAFRTHIHDYNHAWLYISLQQPSFTCGFMFVILMQVCHQGAQGIGTAETVLHSSPLLHLQCGMIGSPSCHQACCVLIMKVVCMLRPQAASNCAGGAAGTVCGQEAILQHHPIRPDA